MSFSSLISHNWKSGLTVALVSIPLSISLAIASQATPVAGIITAIWAGLIASIVGSSNYNVIGPTGALSGLLASYAITHGSAGLSMLALVTGLFILAVYFLRLEHYIHYIPMSTIHGFSLGVACIIALNQLNFVLNIQNLPKHEKFIHNLLESINHVNNFSVDSLLVFVLFLVALFLSAKVIPHIPSIIILSPIGIVLGYLCHNELIAFECETLASQFGNVSMHLYQMPIFSFSLSLFINAFTVALIAIVETMLSAKMADHMTKTKHNERKEVLGLALANIISGIVGGIPATAALARTSLNIKTGATDKLSQLISSVCIALISVFLLRYFSFMPMAVIAAMLVFVAVRMIEREHFVELYLEDKREFWLAMMVALICVIQDPMIGILCGTVISLLVLKKKSF